MKKIRPRVWGYTNGKCLYVKQNGALTLKYKILQQNHSTKRLKHETKNIHKKRGLAPGQGTKKTKRWIFRSSGKTPTYDSTERRRTTIV